MFAFPPPLAHRGAADAAAAAMNPSLWYNGSLLMRRMLLILGLLIAVAVAAVGGLLVGTEWANHCWVSDMNRLGTAMKQLDQDIKGGRISVGNANYFVKLCDLPLERFDGKSVTYYAGPYARYSATIEFDQSGVKGVSVR